MKKYIAIFLSVILLFTACTKKSEPISTGHIFSDFDIRILLSSIAPLTKPQLPDAGYEQVNSKWLLSYHKEWKADIFNKGVTRWDKRFDCNKFAFSFASYVQLKFYSLKFHSYTKAQALAVGEIWFKQDTGGYHAINIVFDETGVRFFEPQTGEFIELSDAEQKSIKYIRI